MSEKIMRSIKGIMFLIIVGATVAHYVMREEHYRALMGDGQDLPLKLVGLCFIGFLWVIGALLTWSMFNLWVLGRDITKGFFKRENPR
jgi:hypothetical protein